MDKITESPEPIIVQFLQWQTGLTPQAAEVNAEVLVRHLRDGGWVIRRVESVEKEA